MLGPIKFNHTLLLSFLCLEAVRRNVSWHVDFVLNNLEESDPFRQIIVWLDEKGIDDIVFIEKIPLEECREKMRQVGYPTNGEDLKKATYQPPQTELSPECIKWIKDNIDVTKACGYTEAI